MKKNKLRSNVPFRWVFLFTFLIGLNAFPIVLSAQSQSQSQTPVRGERPVIDIASVPTDAVEPGIIRIKFNRTVEQHLDQANPVLNASGIMEFGIPEVDALNQQFGVIQVKRTFSIALRNTKYTERHREWGFHLWYDLILPSSVDFRTAVMAYALKGTIELSEPIYKKHLIDAETKPIPYTPTTPGGNTGLSYIPNDPRYNEQWHYHNTGQQSGTADADIDLPEAWDITKGSDQVVVAVIDQGIEYTHSDLAANMWPTNGYNFHDDNATIIPGDHGTHVAGTIAANTNNAVGVSGIAGGTGSGNGVRLMSCQVFIGNSGGIGFGDASIWAADNGAAISQNSWGYNSPGYYDQAVLDGIDYFNANGGGTVMTGGITIYAAGNNGASGLYYPGCYSGCFSVAATNNQDIKSYYSNYDTWVDISAPGGETISITARGVLSCLSGNTYGFYQGTSMACPHVSGVAALILSLAPGQLTPNDIKTILTTSSDDISAINPGYIGDLGSGRLNAYQALLLTSGYIDPLIPGVPQNFTATTISTSQINLSWALNADNDGVMLAYNTSNTFGTPSGNYANGASITGGGTVLYQGSLINFQHSGLNPSTTYYYAIWSKDVTTYSLISVKDNATTLCGEATLPLIEAFVASDFPSCWDQTSTISDRWSVSTTNVAGGSPNEMEANWTNGIGISRMITTPVNTSGIDELQLSFKHYFDDYSTGLTYKIQSSADGVSWTDESWVNSSGSGDASGTVSLSVTSNLGSVTYIAWVLDGDHYQFDNWFVDDVNITGTSSGKTLTIFVLPEGLYNGSSSLNKAQGTSGDQFAGTVADKVTIELHNSSNYNTIVHSIPNADLNTNGTATVSVPSAYSGSYYVTVKHRNSVETCTSNPVSFAGSNISWNFDAANKAYGNNLKPMSGGGFALFGGDVNQDKSVDLGDMSPIDNDASTFATGYLLNDVNGDGLIDTGDMTIVDNNSSQFVGSVLP